MQIAFLLNSTDVIAKSLLLFLAILQIACISTKGFLAVLFFLAVHNQQEREREVSMTTGEPAINSRHLDSNLRPL
jgi:hypothetical protein